MINTGNDLNSDLPKIPVTRWSRSACLVSPTLLLICANWAFAAHQSVRPNEPINTTKKDILAAVKKIRSRIQDLTISFSFNALGGPPGMYRNNHTTAVVKGSKMYFDYEYGGLPKDDSKTFRRHVAYNGKRTTIHQVGREVASVRAKRPREARTQGKGFFDMMLLNPPRRNYQGRSDQSLISLLRSRYSRLREHIEVVDGHPSYVVDLYRAFRWFDPLFGIKQPKHPSMTVWLDKERGFLPIRCVYYTKPDFEDILMEFIVEQAIEAEEGLWFAVKGRKSVFAGMAPTEYVLELDGWKDGKPSIAVNSGIQDEFFDLWKRLPPATKLWDRDAEAANEGLNITILVSAFTVLAIAAFVTIRLRRLHKGRIPNSIRQAPGL